MERVVEENRMTVGKIERWIALLPPNEVDQPCITVDGRSLTPRQMLSEARAGTELGRKAQERWERVGLGTEESMLVERIKHRLERYPPDKPLFITMNGTLTPKQMMSEVEARSKIGTNWLRTERSYLKYMDRLKERV